MSLVDMDRGTRHGAVRGGRRRADLKLELGVARGHHADGSVGGRVREQGGDERDRAYLRSLNIAARRKASFSASK